MDAFESLISMLLRHRGYWTIPSFKVNLTKDDKQQIGRASSPRWELDLVAYKGSTNEILAIECKSFLDSSGVIFRNGTFEPENRYKLFTESNLREVVLKRLSNQLHDLGFCPNLPKVTLCLVAGKLAKKSDREGLLQHFKLNNWEFFDAPWIKARLKEASLSCYENDIAFIVSKIIHKD